MEQTIENRLLREEEASSDGTNATFVMEGEGHTLGNFLRYLLNQK